MYNFITNIKQTESTTNALSTCPYSLILTTGEIKRFTKCFNALDFKLIIA